MLGFLRRLFNPNEKLIKRYRLIVEEINSLEPSMESLSDSEMRDKTSEFKKRLEEGQSLDDILPEAFALVREAGRRFLKMRHFDVQIIGGIGLHEGKAIEMKTGEGKTLVATLPTYLNALTGKGVHVITVNDYLAERDMNWMGKIYGNLGLTVGLIKSDMSPSERRKSYSCDITYGTNNEFGFDYLRDNMAIHIDGCVQRGHNFAIVDEVDSILVDEARTPLIISGPVTHSNHRYREMNPIVAGLVSKQNRLLKEYANKIEKKLSLDEVDDDMGISLFQMMKGNPKDAKLLGFLEDVRLRKLLNRTELDFIELKANEWLEELFFIIDERGHSVEITDKGRDVLSQRDPELFVIPDLEGLYEEERNIKANISLEDEEKNQKLAQIHDIIRKSQRAHLERNEIIHNVQQLCKAYTLFRLDVEYVVQDNKVLIVDEFTGRLMPGRRFSDGLHQALEAKENVQIEGENQVLATITLQNYFRMYEKLAGMTGTCETEAKEFHEIYKLDVVVIPTHRPIIRDDMDDMIFKTERAKYKAIVRAIEELHEKGQPVLVGTVSIEKSELLSKMLKTLDIPHEVLNAKQHQREAEIVALAGRHGAVTIATNMAGRGTDIVLDEEAKTAGGLFVLGTERHESRRIDNQLRGRSGRLGDPGTSKFFLSLEDDLMRLFGSDNIAGIMDKLGMDEDEPIEHSWVTGALERAQGKVEERNFQIRKYVLDYDDVMNLQRDVIYKQRRRVLENEDMKDGVLAMMEDVLEDLSDSYLNEELNPSEWDNRGFKNGFERLFPISIDMEWLEDLPPREEMLKSLRKKIYDAYEKREKMIGLDRIRELERIVVLQTVDSEWKDHLFSMDTLKEGIHLRSIGQRDPLVEYKKEGAELFSGMIDRIKLQVTDLMFRLQLAPFEESPKLEEQTMFTNKGEASEPIKKSAASKVGRNDPCPCGSGKKYKKCCGS